MVTRLEIALGVVPAAHLLEVLTVLAIEDRAAFFPAHQISQLLRAAACLANHGDSCLEFKQQSFCRSFLPGIIMVSTAQELCYHLNDKDEIIHVNDEWLEFALTNEGNDLIPEKVLGRYLWDFIADSTTVQIYRQLVDKARQGKPTRFTLRCDSPDCRRLLEMTISSDDEKQVQFATRILYSEKREPVVLLSRNMLRSDEFLRTCSWCNKFAVGGERWVEVEDALVELRVFEKDVMPRLTHGICKKCFEEISKEYSIPPSGS